MKTEIFHKRIYISTRSRYKCVNYNCVLYINDNGKCTLYGKLWKWSRVNSTEATFK